MSDFFQLVRSLTAAKLGIRMSTGKLLHVTLSGRATVHVLEVEDVLFRHDSAVMLPEAYENVDAEAESPDEERITGLDVIRTLFLRAKEYPTQKFLLTGHTDTTGSDQYNVTLSEKRGNSVMHMMLGNRDEWADISDKHHLNEDIQQILTWANREFPALSCDPQGIDGIIGTNTRTAIRNFQTNFDPIFGRAIGIDEVVGPETWGAFFDVYQRRLAQMLDTDEAGLPSFRNAVNWVDPNKKAVGCGENWPIESANQNDYRSRINRRVEILMFDPTELPPLDCHPQPGKCDKAVCVLHDPTLYNRVHLPVHPHIHPQSMPIFKVPDRPGSTNFVPLHTLHAYLAYFNGDALDVAHTQRYAAVDGKLCDRYSKTPEPIDCDREAYLYCSHRDDLRDGDPTTKFKKDGSGLPLVGPIMIPCGQDVEVQVDIWAQNDWIVIDAVDVDGAKPSGVLMGEWKETYDIGYPGVLEDGTNVWGSYNDQREKMRQEAWKGVRPIEFLNFSTDASKPLWVATLSDLPTPKAKAILTHSSGTFAWHVGSFNELVKQSTNILRRSHHTYDKNLVSQLIALPNEDIPPSRIDALSDPPARCLLPGDICWHNQGQTNYCGAYSFAAAMNYWRPYTCHPGAKNGGYWHGHVDYLLIPNGARTPAQIVDAANNNGMFGRDNNAESLANNNDRNRSLKLIKLWIKAGVPVLVLVEESYNTFSLHWKVVVGYDGNRLFVTNSGADDEQDYSTWEAGINYRTSPVGNDVDSFNQLYNKWKSAGGGIVDAFSSVDGCTFIPIYPRDSIYASDTVQ